MEKKILSFVAAMFFIIMIVFTFVSRNVGVKLLPEVEAIYPRDGRILPSAAVESDEKGGGCVYMLVEEDSILGVVTVAERRRVKIIEKQGEEVVVDGISGVSHIPFVKDLSAGVNDGDRVRIKNDGRT